MAQDTNVAKIVPPEPHVRPHAIICPTCGALILDPRPRQKHCSGACRAKASRLTRQDRLTRDLQELQRRVEAILGSLEK